jgi:hypothetical protein
VARILPDGASYFGPIRSERLAREAVACLHALYPLGAQDPAARDAALAEAEALLEGDAAAVGRLGLRLPEAIAEGRLEIDPAASDGPVEALLGVLGALARVRRGRRRAAVIVEPGRDEGTAEAFFVAGGIVRSRTELTTEDWRDGARAGLDVVRRAGRRPAALAPDALDEVTIVEGRVLDGAATGFALPLQEGWRTAEALSWVEGAVALACASRASSGST